MPHSNNWFHWFSSCTNDKHKKIKQKLNILVSKSEWGKFIRERAFINEKSRNNKKIYLCKDKLYICQVYTDEQICIKTTSP